MKKVLVLGGTGAMGVSLVKIISENNKYNVYVTSRKNITSTSDNVIFIQGNARDNDFLLPLLKKGFDIIVDFMNYDYDEFTQRIDLLLTSCRQYIWFSSCRVYADSSQPLTETSPRLLEVSDDIQFLATNRYALRKARQEDLIINSGYSNYTIIRPYITYNDERLQLGIYEKEQWLYRLLRGRDLVINEAIVDKKTTLTFGYDVSFAISQLIDNEKAYAQVIQIASSETMKWSEILSIYLRELNTLCGITPKIYTSSEMSAIDNLYEGGYNTIYDRVYDRSFDSAYINSIIGNDVFYTKMSEGITRCVRNFLNGPRNFLNINWQYEAYQDILTDCMADRSDFNNEEEYKLYMEYRNSYIDTIPGLSSKSKLLLND